MRYSTKTIAVCALLAVLTGCAGTGAPEQARSEAAANGAAATLPDDLALEYQNAQTLLSVEDYAGAAQILEPLANRYPAYPGVATTLAISWRQLDRADDALALLQATLAAADTYAPGWNEVGILHREAGRFNEAEAAYLKAVTVNPDYALAHLNYGILLDLYLGRTGDALQHYQRYQELAPSEDKQVQRWIADLSRRLERTTRAAQVAN